MILNYDKKEGFSSVFSKFVDDGVEVIEISQEIKDAFSKLEGQDGIIGASVQDAYDIAEGLGVANKEVVDFVRTGKGGLKEYEAAMKSASKSTSNFQKGISTLKNIGGTLLSTFANMAVAMAASWAVGKVIEGIDNYIHRVEIAIEKGKEAQEKN